MESSLKRLFWAMEIWLYGGTNNTGWSSEAVHIPVKGASRLVIYQQVIAAYKVLVE